MKKRLLSGLLCAVLLLSLTVPALAAEASATEAEAAQVLAALNIMSGDENGNLGLDRQITRAEFTKLAVAASAYADSVGPTASVSPYPDVPKNNWAAPFVQVAKEKGLVKGFLDGTFRPMNNITLVEGVIMALRLLGYQDTDFPGAWGSGQMAMYQTLKLDKNITIGANDPMTKRDALWLFYNLLTAKNKSGQVYLTTLGHTLTASGEIDRVALINSAMEGPVVAESGWQGNIPFDTANAVVYRAGSLSSLSAIQSTDVVYHSKSMRTLWAYTNKVTGSIQKVAPSASNPSSVTVGNQTYTLETATAAYDLSDLGTFKAGDTVTLLLGRNGGVAAVRKPGEAAGTVYGIVTATGTGTYQDSDGKNYTAGTVTVTATDGDTYTYRWEDKNKKFEAGDMVQVAVSSGGTKITKLSKTSLTGKADGLTFAPDAEIIDTYGKTSTAKVYPARLAGITFKADMVRYYVKDGQGAITHMILNDVTGDMHQYGVLTGVSETSLNLPTGFITNATYAYDLGGTPGVYSSDKVIWNLKKGACQVKMDGGKADRIYNLTELKLTSVDGNKATAGNQTYTMADGAAVYELRNDTYYLSDLSRVNSGSFTLTGWYDKAEGEGGRVRVIIAKAN